ncbi:MAG: sodium-translocating pyrophosphatase [Candidatus Bathyarchaeia archaeon]
MEWFYITPIAGLTAVGLAIYLYKYVTRQDSGTERMREIANAIKEGAKAYLRRQNMTLAVFAVVMAAVLGVLYTFYENFPFGLSMTVAYLFGSFCTTVAAYIGMMAAVEANVRTANAARQGLKKAFPVAFYGGAVMGLCIVGLALLGVSLLYYLYSMVLPPVLGWIPGKIQVNAAHIVLGFSFGASALALFAKAGGGIYTKTADISADLVGKVELGIPEDDPRNPAVIADNVGDNVGDVAGMGADLIDSYIASIVAAMMIGATMGMSSLVALPLLISAVGLFASIIGAFIVKLSIKGNPGAALNRGSFATWIFFAVFLFAVTRFSGLPDNQWLGVFLPTVAGLIAGVIIGITSDYFTSIDRMPAQKVAKASTTGAAINILTGFSYGVVSIVPPVIGICAATIAAWNLAKTFGIDSLYGIAIAAVGMLATVGMTISADAYGPVSDNAKGIAEQSGLGEEVIEIADRLDAAGNTTKAITKGFAIGAAALTVLALFGAYKELVEHVLKELGRVPVNYEMTLNLMDPEISAKIVAGIFLGGMMPPLLSALLILAVGRNAERMVEEVRRQFREIPGLMEGKAKPDYAKCVDIATKGAIKELILPCLLAIIVPIITLIALGKEALAGFLAGSIVTGIIFALFMANAGGLWDNAKKYIEAGAHGGKGSEAHKAAVTGDTVGDPFKDTAGPSLNTMITVMSLVAEVFAPLILLLIA